MKTVFQVVATIAVANAAVAYGSAAYSISGLVNGDAVTAMNLVSAGIFKSGATNRMPTASPTIVPILRKVDR